VNVVEEQMVADSLDDDYCRLQLTCCRALRVAKRAEYDVIQYKMENFDKPVRISFSTVEKIQKYFIE
jgi:hypothetical protein